MRNKRALWAMFVACILGLWALVHCQDETVPLDPKKQCIDKDGDRYGQDCLLGPDCDDANSKLNFSCDCNLVAYQGCPCSDGPAQVCFESEAKFVGVGVCRSGSRSCQSGKFSGCLDQVIPALEFCNGKDDDCDGHVDEGLGCSACGPRCFGQNIGSGSDVGFDMDNQNGSGLVENDDGELVLQQGVEREQLSFLWVANSDEGTVSKINTKTGYEEGRYVSALHSTDARNRGHAPVGGQNEPSRTAVDFNGDVWVANRARQYQGTVTKIAHKECIDVNGNGKIDTSRDVNGNHVINLDDPVEYLGDADECILFTVDVGGNKGLPRALALDAGTVDIGKGNAWVGLYNENKFYLLDAKDGSTIKSIEVPLSPYGAAIDSRGTLWAVHESGAQIVSINTVTRTAGPLVQLNIPNKGSYGIAIDAKNRVWLGGYPQEQAARYDPADGSTFVVDTPGKGVGRGIAADGEGYIWMAHSWVKGDDKQKLGRLTRFKAEDGSDLRAYDFPAGKETIGVGLDFFGDAWGINRSDTEFGACRVSPKTGQIDCHPTGAGTYTYSDFTGFALQHFTSPAGFYRHSFVGCGLPITTTWRQVSWNADVPNGTAIKVYVRVADTAGDLATAARVGPFTASPADLTVPDRLVGEMILVEVELSSDVEGLSPAFKSLSVQWVCGGDT